jgi:hypothetical protein
MRNLVAALVLAVSLAGCANAPSGAGAGDGGGATDPAAILIAAAEKTEAAGSAHLAFYFSVQSADSAQSFTGDADVNFGDGDPATAEAHMRFAFPKSLGMNIGSMEMTMDAGPIIYMRSPVFTEMLGAPTPWIKIDPARVPGMADQLGSLTGGQADPTGSLTMLYGLVDVEEVGVETVDGASATHYRATFDLSKAVEQIPATHRDEFQQAMEGMKQQTGGRDLTNMPIDIWVDGDGYLKQFQYLIEIPEGTTGDGGSFASSFGMTMTLSNVGDPVDIQPPPADQVTDILDLTPSTTTP